MMLRGARNLNAVGIPLLLVRGEHSDVLSPEGVAEFRSVAPSLEYVDVRSARHMVVGDSNSVFGSVLIEWVKRVAGGAGAESVNARSTLTPAAKL